MNGCGENSVDNLTKRQRHENMAKVRSRGNASTELKALQVLRRGGLTGWRRHFPVFGRPDFAFPKSRVALFIDGCFWHGCPRCYKAPKSSAAFWRQKLSKNRKRDRQVSRQLRKDGWKVVRVWECRLKTPARLLRRLKDAI
jgi:DNA mismatch endonuclease (patch repair protein)